MKQTTNTILMIEPVAFGFNAQTATNNYFQKNTGEAQSQALSEFTTMVAKLRENGVNVIVVKDTKIPHTPDSIFPNNWISLHEDGNIAFYPMFAENRRLERREDVLELIEEQGFIINEIYDYTEAESENIFLEGTGSIILDRENRIAYAAISPRTDEELFIEFCEDFEYTPIIFTAYQTVDNNRLPIYHTNVMMCVADTFSVICLESIDDKKERKSVIDALQKSNKEIIEISETQMHQFAGNMLQVQGNNGNVLVMSDTAKNALTLHQIKSIEKHCEIISVDITTIETNGGGSARCMMAEIFLPKK